MSILIIEPNRTLQGLLAEQLKPIDGLIALVESAEAAQEVMSTLRFHLLIVEPYGEGHVDWLSATPYKPPVLVLSSLPAEHGKALAQQIGAAYLQKPYLRTRLLAVVVSLLEQSGRCVRNGLVTAAVI